MPKSRIRVVTAVALMSVSAWAQAQSLVLPTIAEATDAIVDMLEGTGLSRPSKVKLGTCVAAEEATHPGQVACTVAVTMGAVVNENQMDFYKQGKKWKAQPSSSQDKLPFPDPKVQ
ncbi:hypothetical protein DDE05_00105 [Streptomyces cavourensis]|jgi:hypothetical protein|uniref:hypothetical protein n=1 Tax=unclassified Achromobacter TaxID=2626865 RepID=UPI000DF884CE|nr:hypothetical protein DDE05_00105 [Streptomyces cavourensis]